MRRLIHTVLNRFLEVLFPERCLGCRKEGELLCQSCLAKSKKNFREKSSLPFLDRLFGWGSYEDKILREALRRFKYHGTYGLASPLTQILHDLIKPHLSSFSEKTVILPIPLHPRKELDRGYNQAALLAEKLSAETKIPFDAGILKKIKAAPSQTTLSGRERVLNVYDSFGVKFPERVKNKTVLLVDDISTTGATLSEAARVLKNSGAKRVIGLVVAR